jgi:hypothetical protein
MIDKLFSILLVVNVTGLFGFIAPQVGLSIGHVTFVMLVLNLLYLFARLEYSSILLLHGKVGGWMFVLMAWPLLTMLYTVSIQLREAGLLIYYFTLFLGALVYTAANGLRAMERVMLLSCAVTLFGLVASMVVPEYFWSVASLAGAHRLQNEGRAFGFFLQPNSLAVSMGILFVGWFGIWSRKTPAREVVAIGVLFVAMLLTGSRTGILMAVITTGLILLPSRMKGLGNSKYMVRAVLLAIGGFAGLIAVGQYLSQAGGEDNRRADLLNRIQTMASFQVSDDGSVQHDGSVKERLQAQMLYVNQIRLKPLFGHGLGSETYYKANLTLVKTAHSQVIISTMQIGLIYSVVFVVMFLQFHQKVNRKEVERLLETSVVTQFVCIVLLLFMINGDLLSNRAFYALFGVVYGAVCLPQYIFRRDPETGQLLGILTKSEIAERGKGNTRNAPSEGARSVVESGGF